MNIDITNKAIVILMMMAFYFPSAVAQERLYSVGVTGAITTSSRLFFNPNDPDEISRNQSLNIDGVWSFGVDVRRVLSDKMLSIGISAEYISALEQLTIQDASNSTITVEDGYRAVPVELTGYFCIPFSSESFRVYMGGGIGGYFGERKYHYASYKSQVVERTPGFGIHVLSGFELDILSSLMVRSELKFRDVQFESTNIFPETSYVTGIQLPNDNLPFTSRISINGLLVSVSLAYKF